MCFTLLYNNILNVLVFDKCLLRLNKQQKLRFWDSSKTFFGKFEKTMVAAMTSCKNPCDSHTFAFCFADLDKCAIFIAK